MCNFYSFNHNLLLKTKTDLESSSLTKYLPIVKICAVKK